MMLSHTCNPVWLMTKDLRVINYSVNIMFRKFASGDHLEVLVSAAVGRLFDKLDTAATKGDCVRPLDKFTEFTSDIQNVMCFGLEV